MFGLEQADDPALSHWPEERLRVVKRSEEDEDKAETRQQQVSTVSTCSCVPRQPAEAAGTSAVTNAACWQIMPGGYTPIVEPYLLNALSVNAIVRLNTIISLAPCRQQHCPPFGPLRRLCSEDSALKSWILTPVQRIYRHRQRLVEERQAKEAKAAGRPGAAGQKAAQQPATHHGGQSVGADAASHPVDVRSQFPRCWL